MNFGLYVTCVIAICLTYVGAYAGLNYLSQNRIVNDFVDAVEKQDTQAIKDRIQFEKAAKNVKKSIGDNLNDPTIIDYYAKPDYIPSIFILKDHFFSEFEARDFIRDVSFDGPFRFSMVLGYPKKEGSGEITTLNESLSQVRAYFRLDGWTWKIYKADMPDFIVPKIRLTPEQINVRYGSPKVAE